jgi:hypothetical protein
MTQKYYLPDHKTNEQVLDHYTNLWCKQKGISMRVIEQHPQADDVVMLVNWRDAMWDKLDKKQQGSFAGIWSYVYSYKKPIRQKHLTKLESITLAAMASHIKQQQAQARIKARIKALRPKNPGTNKNSNFIIG